MFARRTGSAYEVLAPAKLNLHLSILCRRDDGFHELETIMAPVSLHDRLAYSPANGDDAGFRFSCRNVAPGLPAPPQGDDNLAYRALLCLAAEAGVPPRGDFQLEKRIPAAAGLGGGSSDAAAALTLANRVWGIHYPTSRLADMAAALGSDVPFFLAGGAAACRGRGEQITPLPNAPSLPVVIVKPNAGVSTPAAFAALNMPPKTTRPSESFSARLAAAACAVLAADWGALSAAATNALQNAAERLCPAIARIRRAFERLDVPAHCMTGSGSAYFAICRSARHARRIAALVRAQNLGMVFASATCR